MPKPATFPTSNSAVPYAKTTCSKLCLSFMLLSVLNTSVCKINIIPMITKQNSVQVSNWCVTDQTLFYLQHHSPIKALLIKANVTISCLICFLKSCPRAMQAVVSSFVLPDYTMDTSQCFFLFSAFNFLWRNINPLACSMPLIKSTEH